LKKRSDTIPFPDGIRLSEYLDDALDPQTRAQFEASMARDPSLRHEVDSLRDTISILQHLPTEGAPPGLVGRVRARTRPRFCASQIGYIPEVARFPFEAAFNILLIAVLLGFYSGVNPAPDGDLRPIVTVTMPETRSGG
jgi:anti-sigma factor RsiW